MPEIKKRSLDRTEVEKILQQANARKSNLHVTSFLTTHIETIAKAVNNKQEFVIIEGRRFSIEHKPYYGGCVLLNPDVGFVPSGYISLSRLNGALKGEN